MSGEQESKTPTIDEKHQRIVELLMQYPEKVGIGCLQANSEVNRFLSMTSTEQRRLDAVDCGEAAVILSQSAVYVQLESNRIQADINWCNKCIDHLVASTIANFGTKYTPFDYRRLLAIKNNDVAMKLHKIITNAQLRVDAMAYIPNQLRGVASAFSDLQQTKRSQRA